MTRDSSPTGCKRPLGGDPEPWAVPLRQPGLGPSEGAPRAGGTRTGQAGGGPGTSAPFVVRAALLKDAPLRLTQQAQAWEPSQNRSGHHQASQAMCVPQLAGRPPQRTSLRNSVIFRRRRLQSFLGAVPRRRPCPWKGICRKGLHVMTRLPCLSPDVPESWVWISALQPCTRRLDTPTSAASRSSEPSKS